jgi:uncharacterized membrane protein YhiD involved in acid resistance
MRRMPTPCMSDFFVSGTVSREPLAVFLRLILAMVLGGIVAAVYRRTRYASQTTSSFTVTLVLLSILIAMVTQVIGDNVARAFSLVGALSIVRFRTVVRDTQDTAFVIFAVAVGMAVGAAHPWLAIGGIVVTGFAAYLMRERAPATALATAEDAYVLQVRVGVGSDPNTLLASTLESYLRGRRLQSIATARQGLAVDVTYRVELRADEVAGELVRAVNRLEGVQSVTLQRHDVPLE